MILIVHNFRLPPIDFTLPFCVIQNHLSARAYKQTLAAATAATAAVAAGITHTYPHSSSSVPVRVLMRQNTDKENTLVLVRNESGGGRVYKVVMESRVSVPPWNSEASHARV